MIVSYLNSTVYNSKNSKIQCKLYYNKKAKFFKTSQYYSCQFKKELISFDLLLKNIILLINKNNIKPIHKINIYTKYITNYHYKLLFDTWEYINFRGIKYSDEWRSIYLLINEMEEILEKKYKIKKHINFNFYKGK